MAKEEKKRLNKSEKHKSLANRLSLHRHRHEELQEEVTPSHATATTAAASSAPMASTDHEEEQVGTLALNDAGQPVRIPATTAPIHEQRNTRATYVDIPEDRQPGSEGSSPTEKISPTGKVKTWFKSRFSRGSKSDDDKPKDSVRKGFIGGHALTGIESNNGSTTSLDGRSASIRAIAMAGRQRTDPSEDLPTITTPAASADDGVSAMSSDSEEEYFDEARDQLGTELSPPRHIHDPAQNKNHSPVRDSRFHEII